MPRVWQATVEHPFSLHVGDVEHQTCRSVVNGSDNCYSKSCWPLLNQLGFALQEKLVDAVVKRLMSDAPLAMLLSGGLDSSLIAAIACR